jgi:hypothetical protein
MGSGGGDISSQIGTLGGLTNNLTGISSEQQALAPPVENLAANTASLSPAVAGYGNQTLGTAENQYQTGAAGQLTPGWNALAQNQLTQANLGTTAQYGNLGLGDSTMKTQDINANTLQNLAEKGNLAALEEQLGIQGLSTGTSMVGEAANINTQAGGLYGTASSILGGAGNTLTQAGALTQDQAQDIMSQAQQGKSNITSGIQDASSIGNILGGGAGTLGLLGAL